MKIEEHKTEKKFEPITFTVTLESKEELASWYARFNATCGNVAQDAPDGFDLEREEEYESKATMWRFINRHWEAQK